MHTIVLERFPEWSEQITLLLARGRNFAELCSDYDELASWLATHSHEDYAPESEWAANCLLLAEMEVEILRHLQAEERQSRQ